MQGIGNFFDKFRNVALKELRKREIICEAIQKATKQKIDMSDISIKNGIIFVKGDQGMKSEIFLKKGMIIELIAKTISNFNVVDIK